MQTLDCTARRRTISPNSYWEDAYGVRRPIAPWGARVWLEINCD
jgi:hypothetical protein